MPALLLLLQLACLNGTGSVLGAPAAVITLEVTLPYLDLEFAAIADASVLITHRSILPILQRCQVAHPLGELFLLY